MQLHVCILMVFTMRHSLMMASLILSRQEYTEAMAACKAAQEAAAAAAEEKARLLIELQQARAALNASAAAADSAGASRDAESAYLAAQLKVPFSLHMKDVVAAQRGSTHVMNSSILHLSACGHEVPVV